VVLFGGFKILRHHQREPEPVRQETSLGARQLERALAEFRRAEAESSPERKAAGFARALETARAAALQNAAEGHPGRQARALRLAGSCLSPGWNPEGDWAVALAVADEVIAACRPYPEQREYLVRGLLERGWCLLPDNDPSRKDWALPVVALEEVDRLCQGKGAKPDLRTWHADALFQQAWCRQPGHHPDGSWEQARTLYVRALRIYEVLEHDAGHADCLRQIARLFLEPDYRGRNRERGVAMLKEAVGLYRTLGNRAEQVRNLKHLAGVLRPDLAEGAGSWKEAEAVYEQLAALHSEEEPFERGEALFVQALCRVGGDWSAADDEVRHLVGEAEDLFRVAGDDERADEVAAVLKAVPAKAD